MKKYLYILLIIPVLSLAQVGINTTTPAAQLEIKSSNQATPANTDGILIPKIDAFPVINPTAAQQGMMLYLTTTVGSRTPGFYFWDNTTANWIPIGNNSNNGWSITGNAGTNPTTHFIGTTDNVDVIFKRNNIKAGLLSATNTSFGSASLTSNTTGVSNSAFGVSSLLANTTGIENSAFGVSSLSANTSGIRNSAFGINSLISNTTGDVNSAFGAFSLLSNTTGSFNAAFGVSTLRLNLTGLRNSAFGNIALNNNSTGNDNSSFGYFSMSSNTTGGGNSAFGINSLNFNTIGSQNSAFGQSSLSSNTTGNLNSAFGKSALSTNSTGSNNSAFGNNADVLSSNLTNATAIGANAEVGASDSLVLGSINGINTATADTKVGIGTTIPLDKLHVVGNIRMVDGNQATGKVLTSNANGTATWQTPAAAGTTLDGAYDFGGAGAGRTITADAGAVTIAGTDGFVSTGTLLTGVIIPSGAGTRMVWNPNKGAFRAGNVSGTEWDNVNVGFLSVALGSNSTASGDNSTALGINTVASNIASTAMGRNSIASGTNSTAMGFTTSASAIASTAMGSSTIASASSSTAMGNGTIASANSSTAMGNSTTASGIFSTAMGKNNLASGSTTFAGGFDNVAPSFGETVIGVGATTYTPSLNGATQFGAANVTDRLLVVGNAIDANNNNTVDTSERRDALVILKNGNTGIGSSTPQDKLHVVGNIRMVDGNQAAGRVLTSDANGTGTWTAAGTLASGTLDQAYDFGGAGAGRTITADTGAVTIAGTDGLVSTGTVGSGALAPSGAGYRMVWNPKKTAFRAGEVNGVQWDDVNIGRGSTAFGSSTIASGFCSLAFGVNTTASQQNTTAFGFGTLASAISSTAFGNATTASGTSSTAFGTFTTASGGSSTAFGSNNTAPSLGETVLGIGATNYTPTLNGDIQCRTANTTDRLLVVGNAIDANSNNVVDAAERSDALVILKNGNTGIGNSAPEERLHVVGKIRMVDGNEAIGNVMVSDVNGTATWTTPGASTAGTLDQSYDFGGAGAGRTITADAGAVTIAGTDGLVVNGNSGLGVATPVSRLQLQTASNATKTTFTQGLPSSGVLITTDYIADNYTPGVFWSTTNNSVTKPKAGIYLRETALGTNMIFGTSNSYVNGITNDGIVIDPSGNVGIGTTAPGGQLQLSLDQGRKPGTNTWTIVSDQRLKTINGSYTKGLNEILQLNPIRFNYKNNGERTFEKEVLDTEFAGFIAQEVQPLFPDAVGTDKDGFLNFNIHPILIASVNALKELNEKNTSLREENEALKQAVEEMRQQIELIKSEIEKLKQ